MNTWFTIRTFIAFYLLLLGLALMFGNSEQRAFLGAFRGTRLFLFLAIVGSDANRQIAVAA